MTMYGVILFSILAATCYAQVPIPANEFGYVYKQGAVDADVRLDFFLDVSCYWSRQDWPVLLEVADHYGPARLRMVVHLFPLPYLRNGHTGAKGATIVDTETGNTDKTFEFIQKCFDNFDNLTRTATFSMTDDAIINMFADLAAEVGVNKTMFMTQFHTGDSDWPARHAWKWGCSRGITGTPMYMLNDVIVEVDEWTVDQWKTEIDKLLL